VVERVCLVAVVGTLKTDTDGYDFVHARHLELHIDVVGNDHELRVA
jgi:hypothetical protein